MFKIYDEEDTMIVEGFRTSTEAEIYAEELNRQRDIAGLAFIVYNIR